MPGHDLIVIGTSAGGVESLTELVSHLPGNLPAAVLVVLHIPAEAPDVLASILRRSGPLRARTPFDGEPLECGCIYTAPPDHHLLVQDSHLALSRGPKENGSRPAIDPLFRSAALASGPRTVGVVLSGTLDDGSSGLCSIKERGGIAVVQDPMDAIYGDMPRNAIENTSADHIVPLDRMGPLLTELVNINAPDESAYPIPEKLRLEVDIAMRGAYGLEQMSALGEPSVFSCPECHGTLWELREGELVRYRCQTGHAYSPDTLNTEQDKMLEGALWAALRSMEESAAMSRRIAERARQSNKDQVAQMFEKKAMNTEGHATVLRKLLVKKEE